MVKSFLHVESCILLYVRFCLSVCGCTVDFTLSVKFNNAGSINYLQALEQRGVSPDSNDLMKHNLVVFRDGEAALQVTLALLPEASPFASIPCGFHSAHTRAHSHMSFSRCHGA